MCQCSTLPDKVLDITLSSWMKGINLEGVSIFPSYFSEFDEEELTSELTLDNNVYFCRYCEQAWYVIIYASEYIFPHLAIKFDPSAGVPTEKDIAACSDYLLVLANNGFSGDVCRMKNCENKKLKALEFCHEHYSLL
jgi:hypothetical protein